jgi:hypothetical protein
MLHRSPSIVYWLFPYYSVILCTLSLSSDSFWAIISINKPSLLGSIAVYHLCIGCFHRTQPSYASLLWHLTGFGLFSRKQPSLCLPSDWFCAFSQKIVALSSSFLTLGHRQACRRFLFSVYCFTVFFFYCFYCFCKILSKLQ